MEEKGFRFPKTLPIIATILIIVGLILTRLIPSLATPEQMATNVLLNALPFIFVFVGILLFFITLIVIIARAVSGKISRKTYGIIESVIIAGIVLGVISMFQPWSFPMFRYGFVLLLLSTLSFIVWSHVSPKLESRDEAVSVGPVSIGDEITE